MKMCEFFTLKLFFPASKPFFLISNMLWYLFFFFLSNAKFALDIFQFLQSGKKVGL